MGLSVIVLGNPFDGMRIIGPFVTGEEAHEWASANADGEEWWCVSVDSPESLIDLPAVQTTGTYNVETGIFTPDEETN